MLVAGAAILTRTATIVRGVLDAAMIMPAGVLDAAVVAVLVLVVVVMMRFRPAAVTAAMAAMMGARARARARIGVGAGVRIGVGSRPGVWPRCRRPAAARIAAAAAEAARGRAGRRARARAAAGRLSAGVSVTTRPLLEGGRVHLHDGVDRAAGKPEQAADTEPVQGNGSQRGIAGHNRYSEQRRSTHATRRREHGPTSIRWNLRCQLLQTPSLSRPVELHTSRSACVPRLGGPCLYDRTG
ncbi:MAG: hypothetical protein QOG02_1957 [Gaiellales bacterium]|nr:hypothetical protein [Gaiellales bacterium]